MSISPIFSCRVTYNSLMVITTHTQNIYLSHLNFWVNCQEIASLNLIIHNALTQIQTQTCAVLCSQTTIVSFMYIWVEERRAWWLHYHRILFSQPNIKIAVWLRETLASGKLITPCNKSPHKLATCHIQNYSKLFLMTGLPTWYILTKMKLTKL